MNKIITIGRQFGSGGREFGIRLAEELDFEYYDNEILTGIVNNTKLSSDYVGQIVESKNHRLYPVTVEHTLAFGEDYSLKQIQDIYRAQTEVIKEMAAKSDCVIVGRCADYILRDVENIELIRIFVYADMESRIKRCMERAPEGEDFSGKEMKKYIQKVDKGRASYYEDFTLQKWGDKNYYDICLNTSTLDVTQLSKYVSNLFK